MRVALEEENRSLGQRIIHQFVAKIVIKKETGTLYDTFPFPAEGQVEMITGLLTGIAPGLPEEKIVLLLADRGIGPSPDLCRNLDLSGWSYLFRVIKQSKIITDDGKFTIYRQVMPGEA